MSIIDRPFTPEPEDEDNNAQFDSETQESFQPMNDSKLDKIDR